MKDPIYIEPLETDAPLSVLCNNLIDLPNLALLDGPGWGTNILTADPFDTLTWHGNFAESRNLGRLSRSGFDALKFMLDKHHHKSSNSTDLFFGAAIGEIAYESSYRLERIRGSDKLSNGQLMRFGFYDWAVTRNTNTGENLLIWTNAGSRSAEYRKEIRRRLLRPLAFKPKVIPKMEAASDFTPREYHNAIQRVLSYIEAGDIYQACISRLIHGKLSTHPKSIYDQVTKMGAPHMSAYLHNGDRATISSSPEMYVMGDHKTVFSQPIKGTRPRSRDPVQDSQLATDLRNSDKDFAENIMIVDVLRNDLGKIAVPGSVTTSKLAELITHPTIHHLESRIEAHLRADIGPIDVVEALFPGGSVTGAPKIRAMEIIAEIERGPRNGYCGVIASIGFDMSMASSIPIRTIYAHKDNFEFRVGGGIVADSTPPNEYAETCDKAASLLLALNADESQ